MVYLYIPCFAGSPAINLLMLQMAPCPPPGFFVPVRLVSVMASSCHYIWSSWAASTAMEYGWRWLCEWQLLLASTSGLKRYSCIRSSWKLFGTGWRLPNSMCYAQSHNSTLLGMYLGEFKMYVHENLYTNAQRSKIHISSKVETIQNIHQLMNW